MDAQPTVEMTEDQGVSEGADAPESADTDSPSVEEQGEQQASESQGEEEVLPFGKHPRWQKMNEENRRYREENRQFQTQIQNFNEQFNGIRQIEQWFAQDPSREKMFVDWVQGRAASLGQTQPQKQDDPYAEFDPLVAERFRELDDLKTWKSQQEQQFKAEQQQHIVEAQNSIDIEYDSRLTKDGYLNQQGQPVNEEAAKFVSVIDKAVLSFLSETAKNPHKPTKQELDNAYDMVTTGLKYAERRGLKNNVVNPSVPLSGSKKGALPKKAGPRTDEERHREIVEMLS